MSRMAVDKSAYSCGSVALVEGGRGHLLSRSKTIRNLSVFHRYCIGRGGEREGERERKQERDNSSRERARERERERERERDVVDHSG